MSQAETQRWAGDHNAEELAEYRPISKFAVASLFVGLASPLAWLGPYAWTIPAAAVVLGIIALVRIARPELALSGRKAASIGLCLGLICGVGASTRYYTYRYLVQREAQQFAMQWFEHIRNGDIEYAHQMAVPIAHRRPITDDLNRYYREHPEAADKLRTYTDSDVVRTLLALGDRANVRLYHSFGVSVYPLRDEVLEEFAVTFEENGVKKSFFLYLLLERHYNSFVGRGQWRISDIRVASPSVSLDSTPEEQDSESAEAG